MDKEKVINSLVAFVNDIRRGNKYCDASRSFVNGWNFEVEYFPSDEEEKEQIFF